jgi:protein-L-isoaspartate O-methyltransferase
MSVQLKGGGMFFVMTGNGEQGAVAVTCETAAAVSEKARALTAEGVRDVLITDADGLQHAPADFDRLFVAAPDVAAPETTSIP